MSMSIFKKETKKEQQEHTMEYGIFKVGDIVTSGGQDFKIHELIRDSSTGHMWVVLIPLNDPKTMKNTTVYSIRKK